MLCQEKSNKAERLRNNATKNEKIESYGMIWRANHILYKWNLLQNKLLSFTWRLAKFVALFIPQNNWQTFNENQ